MPVGFGMDTVGGIFPEIFGMALCTFNWGIRVICVPIGTLTGGDCKMKFCTPPLLFMGIDKTGWFFIVTSVTVIVRLLGSVLPTPIAGVCCGNTDGAVDDVGAESGFSAKGLAYIA